MQIKDGPSLQWLKPISTPVERRDKSKYYRFHQDHEHHIDECRHLKDQVETLIQQQKLQKFIRKTEPHRYQQKDDQDRTQRAGDNKPLAGEIKTISRGLTAVRTLKSLKKAYGKEINSVHSRLPSMKMPKNDEPLVIMLRVEEFNIHRVLIDNRSSVDIIYLPMFQQIRLDKKRIKPFASPLVSFTGDRIVPRGIVTLTVITGTHPAQVTKEINFLLVDCLSTYNIILGRPALD